jgi:succinate dehydrogenase / fumarate reductase flavoprotein subunit
MFKENEPVEVGAVVEYFDGGIVIDERFETGVEGLYAAGECTLGPFGANRVCSAITEMLVHGADSGRNAGEYARKNRMPELDARAFRPLQEEAERPLIRQGRLKPAQVRRRVQEMAHKSL